MSMKCVCAFMYEFIVMNSRVIQSNLLPQQHKTSQQRCFFSAKITIIFMKGRNHRDQISGMTYDVRRTLNATPTQCSTLDRFRYNVYV